MQWRRTANSSIAASGFPSADSKVARRDGYETRRPDQRLRINWADDFDFAAKLKRLGAVAQLGEH
jgi:hypothetical protein